MKYLYWKWDKTIPKSICEEMIKECQQYELKDSTMVENHLDTSIRNSKSSFMKRNHWFEGILFNHILYANNSAEWDFNIRDKELVQYTEYDIGGKYDLHKDHDFLYVSDKPAKDIKTRKLTIVCQLSDSNDFEGGSLVLKTGPDKFEKVLGEQGDIVVFPSYISHKVEPVISGKRCSAVLWALGDHFV